MPSHKRIQKRTYAKGDRCLILSKRSYCVFAPQGFVTKCLFIFIADEVKNFAANIFFKLVCQSRTRSCVKGWRSYIEEFRGSKAVEGFYCEFIYKDCKVQGQRFCTRSETSLCYSGLLFEKVPPRFFIMKLVYFISFPMSSYLVLFIFLLHDFDIILMFVCFNKFYS